MNTDNNCPILLNNLPLPYVTEIKHLGILQSNGSMSKDNSYIRDKFISKIHSLNPEFHYANTSTVLKLYDIYNCDFYGSNLWDLYSRNVQKLLNSFYLIYQEKPKDISLSPFLIFLILKQFYALVLYNL